MITTRGKTKEELKRYVDRLIGLGAKPDKDLPSILNNFSMLKFNVDISYLGVDVSDTIKFDCVPDDFNMYWELKAAAWELVENDTEGGIFLEELHESLNRLEGDYYDNI